MDALMTERVRRVKTAAAGRWKSLLESAGIDASHLEHDNRPCPLCGGRDRFTFYRREDFGGWFCRGCGAGDGIELLRRWRQDTFPGVIAYLEQVLGLPPIKADRASLSAEDEKRLKAYRAQKARETEQQEALEALWNSAVPLDQTSKDDPVRRYLSSRGLQGGARFFGTELRSLSLLDYWETGDDGVRRHEKWPAMLARVSDDKGKLVSLHRTYVMPDGRKAPVGACRKLTAGAAEGGLIRLQPPGKILGIAEGIETALSAQNMEHIPVWSAVSVGGFDRFREVPAGVCKVIVFGDNDRSFTGQAGAYALAARLRRDNPELAIEVRIPMVEGFDWNDVLVKGRQSKRRPGNRETD